ncbi:MAG TPA: SCP2 sterol-binding domain-containing protein [Baekduia sp.]|uniref:SCP2 sterol-binding domain-containing protein n=1 Tax=Baekduia sp. TaxID=2600305 RepID=UPI002C2FB0D2|nr:SCP2 sterol-binding domain-containing protein [Baekduia sp.]HMJ32380.1 SCP2 sterol-binding domain-containing protein [Baekduia sp.]
MAHYETDAEVYDQLGGILTNLVYNAARREQLHQADAVVQFAFRHPDATVTLDVRANKQARVDLGDTKLRADVVLAMDADTGRAILHGELSPTLALARGDVRTKGPVGKVLRVVPVTVGAHEVEADLPIEAPPEPQAAPAEPAAAEAPAAETEAPAEAEAPTAEPEAPAEPAADAAPAEPEAPVAEPEPEPAADAPPAPGDTPAADSPEADGAA